MFSDSHHRCPHVTEQVSQLTEKVSTVTPVLSHVCSCDMGHCTCDDFTCDILEGLFYRRLSSSFFLSGPFFCPHHQHTKPRGKECGDLLNFWIRAALSLGCLCLNTRHCTTVCLQSSSTVTAGVTWALAEKLTLENVWSHRLHGEESTWGLG